MLKTRQQGFTLTELMVTIAVAGILFTMAFPSFTTFITNSRIKNVAIAVQSGLQLARAEAIKTNQPVEFLLFDPGNTLYDGTDISAGNANPNTIGPNWLVRAKDPVTGVYRHVDWYNGYEGSGKQSGSGLSTTLFVCPYTSNISLQACNAAQGINITTSATANNATANAVTFNGLGGTDLSNATVFYVSSTNANDKCAKDGGAIRCLNVIISVAGQVKLCDPAVAAGDTRACS